jgi:starch phosphorylase
MVRDYVEEMYEPAAVSADTLGASGGERAKALAAWKQSVLRAWPSVRVISVETESTLVDLGASKKVEAVVALGQLGQNDVEVQLLHGPVGANEELQPAAIVTMDLVGLDEPQPGAGSGGEGKNLHRYSGSFACDTAGRYGFSVRVVPSHDDLRTFAELGCVAWGSG